MQSQEVSIKPTINIVLKPDTETLDEVVVIAYGTAKKESLTGSISVVDNKKIEKRITTSVTGALEGAWFRYISQRSFRTTLCGRWCSF